MGQVPVDHRVQRHWFDHPGADRRVSSRGRFARAAAPRDGGDCRLARARGVVLADDIVARTLAGFDKVDPGSTASMQRDIMAGRPSELDDQTGAVVRIGQELGVATPVNRFIYDCLLPQERLARASA
ncbi:MAG: ketopantoate reductase C-terminal domain-containing protein [Burkholderiaceae bacterium]